MLHQSLTMKMQIQKLILTLWERQLKHGGVSNNIRPLMRVPRWHEAQFTLATEEKKTINIQLEK